MTTTVKTLIERIDRCNEILNQIEESDFALLIKKDYDQVEMLNQCVGLLTKLVEQTDIKIGEL